MSIRWGLGTGAGFVGVVFLQMIMLAATYAGQLPAAASANAGVSLSAAVPARYRGMLEKAAGKCPQLPVSLFAAQIQAESGFDPKARSGVGAMGIAQFMPGTWKYLGRDANGDGKADPFDPADAFDAQVRFMCDLYKTAQRSGLRGDPVSLALAGYNAGWGAVKKYGGIPPYRETQGYVAKIVKQAAKFGVATAARAVTKAVKAGVSLFSGGRLPRSNPRSPDAAVKWAMAQRSGGSGWYNLCLRFVAQSYGWRSSGVHYAIDHYRIAPARLRHPGDRNPPPGALLFWDTGHRAGHVAISVGNGMIASNDIVTRGRISVVPMSAPERRWGARYVGWTAPYFPHAG